MLNQQTLHKLYVMRLNGMADAFRQQLEQADLGGFSFEERFGLLVDRQWSWKEDRALARRLRNSRLKSSASVEDIDYQTPRGRVLVHGEDEQSGRRYLMLEGVDARVHFIEYTTEMEEARARGELRTNAFARLRRVLINEEPVVRVEDL